MSTQKRQYFTPNSLKINNFPPIYFPFKMCSLAKTPQLNHLSSIWVSHALQAAQRKLENAKPVQHIPLFILCNVLL